MSKNVQQWNCGQQWYRTFQRCRLGFLMSSCFCHKALWCISRQFWKNICSDVLSAFCSLVFVELYKLSYCQYYKAGLSQFWKSPRILVLFWKVHDWKNKLFFTKKVRAVLRCFRILENQTLSAQEVISLDHHFPLLRYRFLNLSRSFNKSNK